MLGRLFRRKPIEIASDGGETANSDDDEDSAADDVGDGYDVVDAHERVERSRQSWSVIRGRWAAASSTFGWTTTTSAVSSSASGIRAPRRACSCAPGWRAGGRAEGDFRCVPLYVFRRDDAEKSPPTPLVADEWELPDPRIDPLSGQLRLEDARSAVDAQRALLAALPNG